jgi:hypothetical protein
MPIETKNAPKWMVNRTLVAAGMAGGLLALAVQLHSSISLFFGIMCTIAYCSLSFQASKSQNIEFRFLVGRSEQHQVRFKISGFWGTAKISVDDKQLLKSGQIAPWHAQLHKKYEFRVGVQEIVKVVIVKHRPFANSWGRKQTFEIFVDDQPYNLDLVEIIG